MGSGHALHDVASLGVSYRTEVPFRESQVMEELQADTGVPDISGVYEGSCVYTIDSDGNLVCEVC